MDYSSESILPAAVKIARLLVFARAYSARKLGDLDVDIQRDLDNQDHDDDQDSVSDDDFEDYVDNDKDSVERVGGPGEDDGE